MYKIQMDGDDATLILSGDVDLQTTAELKSDISELQGINSLDIKADKVSYIDSSGVAVLLMTRQHCLTSGIELSLLLSASQFSVYCRLQSWISCCRLVKSLRRQKAALIILASHQTKAIMANLLLNVFVLTD